MKIDLQPSEEMIDTWTLIFLPTGGAKYNGKLAVTNKRLVYDAQFNVSTLADIYANSNMIKKPESNLLEISKSDITNVEVEKSFFAKKVIITVKGGNKFVFSYGMMNIDPVADAIRKN
ncbi:MAG: hypothetical protein H0U95_03595 [Bacteroidetes bacterium]|nr:hypothetical protein [Bacteroidota bacterium]